LRCNEFIDYPAPERDVSASGKNIPSSVLVEGP
jgi:hypothetical protein